MELGGRGREVGEQSGKRRDFLSNFIHATFTGKKEKLSTRKSKKNNVKRSLKVKLKLPDLRSFLYKNISRFCHATFYVEN